MEIPINNEKLKQISTEEVNVESATQLVIKLEEKIANGETLNNEDVENINEKLTSLREAQLEVDGSEIRQAIAQLVNLRSKQE